MNYKEAMKWFKKAAEFFEENAICNIGPSPRFVSFAIVKDYLLLKDHCINKDLDVPKTTKRPCVGSN